MSSGQVSACQRAGTRAPPFGVDDTIPTSLVYDAELSKKTIPASSLVANLNCRHRGSFCRRRQWGTEDLSSLPFGCKHRPLERSHRPEREGKTPAQRLSDTDRGLGASFDREAAATCGGWTRFRKPGADNHTAGHAVECAE
jgi:hypothetical protein